MSFADQHQYYCLILYKAHSLRQDGIGINHSGSLIMLWLNIINTIHRKQGYIETPYLIEEPVHWMREPACMQGDPTDALTREQAIEKQMLDKRR